MRPTAFTAVALLLALAATSAQARIVTNGEELNGQETAARNGGSVAHSTFTLQPAALPLRD